MIRLFVSSENEAIGGEHRFSRDLSILRLKEKLQTIVGSSPQSMLLQVYDSANLLICSLSNNDAVLESYPLKDYMRIHVIDTDPFRQKNVFSDVSSVKKFELDDTEYDKRSDSVRNFLKKNQLGIYGSQTISTTDSETTIPACLKVKERCQVSIGGTLKRGVIEYVGQTEFSDGTWVGVRYDEPVGKNDGSVNGKQYFQCPMKYGGFVSVDKVTVGDFPEEITFSDEEL